MTDLRRALDLALFAVAVAALACQGSDRTAGEIEGPGRSRDTVVAAARVQAEARLAIASPSQAPTGTKPILFGDLHVHSTWSFDAFLYSLPLLYGEGAHPPADACDFARYCSALDFYALTDHAENLTPTHWQAEKEAVRQCNARAGDPAEPDLVAFTGFEWSQVGLSPESHYGHKNVIFRGTKDSELPARPIGSVDGEG
ncbi:MAG: DUF3604 domain-containing protein, partial [bacterium]|nr:DUF3604 domain-containing protein [bacterium]